MQKKIANIDSLRENLLTNYNKLQNGQLTGKEAKNIADMAGKIMSSCKLELQYAKHHNKKKRISFLEGK